MTGNGHHLIVGHTDSGFSESLAGMLFRYTLMQKYKDGSYSTSH